MLEIRRAKVATAFEPFTFHLPRLTALGFGRWQFQFTAQNVQNFPFEFSGLGWAGKTGKPKGGWGKNPERETLLCAKLPALGCGK